MTAKLLIIFAAGVVVTHILTQRSEFRRSSAPLRTRPEPALAHLRVEVNAIRGGFILAGPFELLDPMSTEEDTVRSACVEGDEVVCTLASGRKHFVSIDHVVCMHQSPEHLEKTVEFWRELRQQKAMTAARRRP